MNRLRGKFLLSLFGLSLVCVGLVQSVAQPSNAFAIILFFTITTWAAFEWVMIDIKPDNFIRNYLLSIVLKITLGCSFIAVLLLVFKERTVANTSLFVSGYVLYTALELFFILRARRGA